jgi:hypothetical protein
VRSVVYASAAATLVVAVGIIGSGWR